MAGVAHGAAVLEVAIDPSDIILASFIEDIHCLHGSRVVGEFKPFAEEILYLVLITIWIVPRKRDRTFYDAALIFIPAALIVRLAEPVRFYDQFPAPRLEQVLEIRAISIVWNVKVLSQNHLPI